MLSIGISYDAIMLAYRMKKCNFHIFRQKEAKIMASAPYFWHP